MWIYTEAVVCNRQDCTDGFRNQKRYSIVKAINWVCPRVQENHQCGFRVLFRITGKLISGCPEVTTSLFHVKHSGSCFGSLRPPSLNDDFLNDGRIFDMYNKVTYMVVKTSFTFPFTRTQTPNIVFLGSTKVDVMIRMDGRVRRLEREMNGWEHGGRPHLLPESEVSLNTSETQQ